MKGVIFNLLEGCVRAEHGERVWDDMLEAAALDGAYTSLGSYPDAHLVALMDAAAKALGKSVPEIERWLGQRSITPLAAHYPEFFTSHRETRSFVLTLNDVIHAEVRKLYPGADVPEFEFATSAANQVTLTYRSARRMCRFAEGLIEGAAAHFAEQVAISQTACMLRGDDTCVIACAFTPLAGNA